MWEAGNVLLQPLAIMMRAGEEGCRYIEMVGEGGFKQKLLIVCSFGRDDNGEWLIRESSRVIMFLHGHKILVGNV
jgi:hypothetical protein